MVSGTSGLTDKDLTAALDKLFSEGEAGARARERSAYDLMAGTEKDRIVLFGVGRLGRKTLSGLRKAGIEPIAFMDNNARLWNTSVDGLEVLSPEEAVRRHGGHATFVITIWSGEGTDRMTQREAQLRRLGCRSVIPFQSLYWKHAEIFLPHFTVDLPHKVHEQVDDVRRAGSLWSDDASRIEYLAQLRFRLLGDFAMPSPVQHTIYFPTDLCPLTDHEVFVDCGAYDGDSIRSFIEQSKNSFQRIYSYEPDPALFSKLEQEVSLRPECESITLRCAAVGAHTGTVTFSTDGNESSHHVGEGEMVVNCVALDEALSGTEPTYLKMDIEGAELDALNGACGIIRRYSPLLAISAYHQQDHLWKIPLLIQSFRSDYNFFLRPHCLDGWDLVLYAIPDHRLARSVTNRKTQ